AITLISRACVLTWEADDDQETTEQLAPSFCYLTMAVKRHHVHGNFQKSLLGASSVQG
ncbi:mCG140153, partial [Mus musculus]